ncbi:MAG: GNAT family N-acetyltransferase [Chloroflexota bacterium]
MFEFLDPGRLVDGDLELVLDETIPADPIRGFVPNYRFRMIRLPTRADAGRIDLRIGSLPLIVMYAGQIGYGVNTAHRGQHFAARAVRLLLPLAKRHDLNPLWITCNPDNAASRRSCELAGGKLIEIVDLPPNNDMYLEGERQKCRYRFDL